MRNFLLPAWKALPRHSAIADSSSLHLVKDQGKALQAIACSTHNRAHPRHYRSEYVRGYLHRQADVYSLPGW